MIRKMTIHDRVGCKGTLVGQLNEEECTVSWAVLWNGEPDDTGEMDVELYANGEWLPYEETLRPISKIPRWLKTHLYNKLFPRLGMRKTDE